MDPRPVATTMPPTTPKRPEKVVTTTASTPLLSPKSRVQQRSVFDYAVNEDGEVTVVYFLLILLNSNDAGLFKLCPIWHPHKVSLSPTAYSKYPRLHL